MHWRPCTGSIPIETLPMETIPVQATLLETMSLRPCFGSILYQIELGESMRNHLLCSLILQRLRCPWFTTDNFSRDDSNKLYACHMCSIRGRLLSPNPMPTRDMCAICGNWSPWKQPTNVAKICTKHKLAASSIPKCYVCGNIIFLNSSMNTTLYLCNYCHVTGSTMMKCVHLEK